jgi:hypothetical protein
MRQSAKSALLTLKSEGASQASSAWSTTICSVAKSCPITAATSAPEYS